MSGGSDDDSDALRTPSKRLPLGEIEGSAAEGAVLPLELGEIEGSAAEGAVLPLELGEIEGSAAEGAVLPLEEGSAGAPPPSEGAAGAAEEGAGSPRTSSTPSAPPDEPAAPRSLPTGTAPAQCIGTVMIARPPHRMAGTYMKAPAARRRAVFLKTLPSVRGEDTGAAAPVPGRILGGKYLIVRLLGSGGMGQVFKGEHVLLGTPVAIKTMHPHIAAHPDSRRRFLREARAASILRHPNVVQVLDVSEERELLYLVMEFLDGCSVAAWLRELGAPPPLREVASILDMILNALEAAHSQGIVHRDLKPENILLTEIAGAAHEKVAKVADFGLVHLDDALDAGPTLTSQDTIAGTPEYMSPEQCRSLAVGPSSDLYAIGCILTALLQRKPPFYGAPAAVLFSNHMFVPPPPLDRPPAAEPIPLLLERLRLDLLAKHPDQRPRSAAEVRARLAEALSPEAAAIRLPGRKGSEPLGDRLARAPAWAPVASARARPPVTGHLVGVLRLGPAACGLDEACTTGLEAQGLHAINVPSAAALAEADLPVVVVDAGPDIDGACAVLAEVTRVAPRTPPVVCAAEINQDRINALVAAGAADVVRYPVTPDVLARKLTRVLRRGR